MFLPANVSSPSICKLLIVILPLHEELSVNPLSLDNSQKVPINSSEEDIIWKDSKRPDGSLVNVNNEMIDNGIIHIIDAGYGSKHDGDQLVIAICDDCIKYYNGIDDLDFNFDDYNIDKISLDKMISKLKNKMKKQK